MSVKWFQQQQKANWLMNKNHSINFGIVNSVDGDDLLIFFLVHSFKFKILRQEHFIFEYS